MINTDEKNNFALGEIQVSPSHNEIKARDKIVKLQPKVMAVLHYLAHHHERVISNEELIQRLWEGRIVTHGSVQKSINSLRNAFTELIGDQDFIAHYSKRGYQLKIKPVFLDSDQPQSAELHSPVNVPISQHPGVKRFYYLGAGVVAFLVLALSSYLLTTNNIAIEKHHKTLFQTTLGYTNEIGHERNAIPHPDNKHVAYIHEKFNTNHQGETESEIVIRNSAGKDWRVATSHGSWFKLAWSPAGKYLVAVEVKRRDGLPLSPNFYEKPNYLYTFHIFSLDLDNERLLEKQLLSQWQGRIFSVTWWDENTLEFVAKQGSNSVNMRYRYSILNQQLATLDEVEGATNPIASTVQRKKTALASAHKNTTQIDFLNEDQSRISRWKLDFSTIDISWIPDGSGILVYAEEERKLFALYLNGQQVDIPFTVAKDSIFSRPRYSPDGSAIFYTEEKRSSNIVMVALDGSKTKLTNNTVLNYSAAFSPTGEQIVYASVRNNQTHLWLIENGQERQLTSQPIPKRVGTIIWSENGEHLVYSAGSNLYHYNFATASTSLLLSDADKIEPIAYFPDTNRLLMLKSNGEAKNLWRVDIQQQKQKQLTFGSVGSAVEHNGDVFFQYVGEKGLWALRSKDDQLEQIAPAFAENNKLLDIDKDGVYFMDGGVCRESDIYYLRYADSAKSTFLARDSNIVSTTSFNARKGALQTECYLPEANIILLK